jgi:hypothetical protein
MARDIMSVKIRLKDYENCENAKYFIKRDKLSDKKYKQLDKNTLVVNIPTSMLLQEIGLSFLVDAYSEDPIR